LNISYLDSKSLSFKLKNGSAVIFPTDTVPALATLPKYSSLIWRIKKRPLDKPLILMGATAEELFKFIHPTALIDAQKMAKNYWPGALTIVMPAFGEFVESLNPGHNTIGLRVPDSSLAIDLLSMTGPLATTSANLSGAVPVSSIEEASQAFPEVPLLTNSKWPQSSGLASSVIEWKKKGNWHLLRAGAVIPENLESQ
tara:strand:+ start:1582 stop:2175 length:594 start_codon:yes stop_codon:yes gene_type:complete